MSRWVVKRDVCYLNERGENRFSRRDARFFNTPWEAQSFAATFGPHCKVWRLVPKGTKARRIAAREERLGILPLGKAICDECPELAFTRWYEDLTRGREKVAYTLCKKHDDEMQADWARRREEFGLGQSAPCAGTEPKR